MILKEYLENLNHLAKENPKSLKMKVVFSIDDEGNAFKNVLFSPSMGCHNGNDFDNSSTKKNAVCIN